MPRILVAEDDEFLRFFMVRALTEQGFDVDAVSDGRKALKLLRGQDPCEAKAFYESESPKAANDDDPGLSNGSIQAADHATIARAPHWPAFDLILSDIVMPALDGLNLSRIVSVEFPEIPMMLITGHAESYKAATPPLSPVRTVMIKPFTLEEMVTAVSTCLRMQKRPEDKRLMS